MFPSHVSSNACVIFFRNAQHPNFQENSGFVIFTSFLRGLVSLALWFFILGKNSELNSLSAWIIIIIIILFYFFFTIIIMAITVFVIIIGGKIIFFFEETDDWDIFYGNC